MIMYITSLSLSRCIFSPAAILNLQMNHLSMCIYINVPHSSLWSVFWNTIFLKLKTYSCRTWKGMVSCYVCLCYEWPIDWLTACTTDTALHRPTLHYIHCSVQDSCCPLTQSLWWSSCTDDLNTSCKSEGQV